MSAIKQRHPQSVEQEKLVAATPALTQVGLLLAATRDRVETLRGAIAQTADPVYRHALTMELITLRSALEWLPDALKYEDGDVLPEPRSYGCQESRAFLLPSPDGLISGGVRFRKNTYTTSDPIAMARIEKHMRAGNDPVVESIPLNAVPNFNRKNIFISWSTPEQHFSMVEREVAEPNYY